MRIVGIVLILASLGLIVFGLIERNRPPASMQHVPTAPAALPVANAGDRLSANFTRCRGSSREDCVVDGDTFWFSGEKYRLLGINAPETSTPQCDAELALGEQATERLIELLNDGPFSLRSGPEETDRYGRKLRTPTRGGESLGEILVAEGLAERWKGYRSSWC